VPGVNDVATLRPDLAAEAFHWDPATVLATSWKRLKWVCAVGHEWTASLGDRTRGNGCPTCKGRRVLAGFNDLATTHPELAEEADGWDPTTVTKGHSSRVTWRCKSGHTWEATPNTRSQGIGCSGCAQYGFSAAKDGWLYLLEHLSMGLLQIGISNVPEQRTAQHEKRGWVVLDLQGPFSGLEAHDTEQRILKAIRDRGVKTGRSDIHEKFDGFTESWLTDDLPARSLATLIGLVDKARILESPT